ncbi:MAG: nuclease-related domain-containing protein [Solirubrobacteraceae bacterium]
MSSESQQRAAVALRTPGRHARAIVLRLRMRTLLALGGVAILATLAGRGFGFDSTIFLGSAIVLLCFILIVCRRLLPLVDRHDRGASGEEHVGGLLNFLPHGWRVAHDVSFGHGNVDHVAIGRPGVFVFETKSHPGPIKVDRLHGATLRQAQAQRSQLERVLRVDVEPLIVFSRAWVDRPLARRKGVRVVPARMLGGYLRSLPASLEDEQIDAIHARLLDAVLSLGGHEQRASSTSPTGRRPRLPAGARSRFTLRARERDHHR